MARPLRGLSDWLGLSGGDVEVSDEIPPWNGVLRRRIHTIQLSLIAASVLVFLILNAEMPAEDGFGGFIPLIMTWMFFALAITITERFMVRIGSTERRIEPRLPRRG